MRISLSIEVQDQSIPLIHHESQHVICDFVDGISFGNVVGLAIQSLRGSWQIRDVSIDSSSTVSPKDSYIWHSSLNLQPSPKACIRAKIRTESINIAPLQTRIVPVTLVQTAPFDGTTLTFKVDAISDDGRIETLFITLAVKHHNCQLISGGDVLRGSFLFATSSPSLFLAIPPISKHETPLPPILALRKSLLLQHSLPP